MPEETPQLVRDISRIDTELKEAVKSLSNKDQHPQFFQGLLRQFRATVEELCKKDILLDREINAHTLLWNAHNLVNGFCRKGLAKLREDQAKPVETRKFIKGYLEFLKESQKWYRVLINVLNKTYGWMPGLEQIIGNTDRVAPHDNPDLHRLSESLCYHALICLGDLCRWRAAEKLDKEPTWSHAVGYYDLAAAVLPGKGSAFHQRAFIEISQKDHFRAIYYFYRSIVVGDRFPNAINNLAMEMKSLRKKWGTDELNPKIDNRNASGKRKALIMWYLRLQSLCYAGEEIPGHNEMENTVLSHLEDVIKLPDSSGLLLKLVSVNMAAERTSLIRLNEAEVASSDTIISAFNSYHRLNIKSLIVLLRILDKEIAAIDVRKEQKRGKAPSLEDFMTTGMHNILPAIRIYHQYLLSSYQFLLADEQDVHNRSVAAELWAMLAQVCSAAAAVFPLAQLPELPYMLEEDVDTIAFEPVNSPATNDFRYLDDGRLKAKFNDQGVGRLSTNLEMLARIRSLQVTCVRLSILEDTPINFDEGRFFTNSNRQTNGKPALPQHSSANGTESVNKTVENALAKAPALQTPQQNRRRSSQTKTELRRMRPNLTAKAPTLNGPQALQSPAQISAKQVRPINGAHRDPGEELDRQDEQAMKMVDDLVGPDDSPHTTSRPMSGLDFRPQRTPSVVSSFAPTLPTSRVESRVERLQNGSLYGQGGQNFASGMHSPLLFGNGGLWSTTPTSARGKTIGTPPNGQAG
ncbi:DNA/RNA binding protein [Elsinoe australis]|uniref:DNA/RNA binding protein n=1 Tax=Elsinoe australis TaxID=40998 RepID=A0A4U7BBC3_9PEZI|nr:DNA/RNA binding protein [Elsinoe australis]